MRIVASPLAVEYALLGFIYEQPAHGYEIYHRLAAPTELWQVWRLKQSQLYALLNKLEDEALIAATFQPQDTRPPRKIYSLTPDGQAAFQRWLTTPVAHGREMRIEFLAKLYFAHRQDDATVHQLLERQLAACQQWLAALQEQFIAQPDDHFFAYAVQQFRVSQIEAFVAWLTRCQQALSAESDKARAVISSSLSR